MSDESLNVALAKASVQYPELAGLNAADVIEELLNMLLTPVPLRRKVEELKRDMLAHGARYQLGHEMLVAAIGHLALSTGGELRRKAVFDAMDQARETYLNRDRLP